VSRAGAAAAVGARVRVELRHGQLRLVRRAGAGGPERTAARKRRWSRAQAAEARDRERRRRACAGRVARAVPERLAAA
jgi:hypothetical protein